MSQTGLPYTVEFFASNPTRTEIFQIAENLHFFQDQINDSTGAQSGGTHRLVFIDGEIRNQAKYHEPSDPRVLALTSLFEKISNTLEFGRRLKIMEQSNPGGIEAELQQMMRMMQAQQLAEMQAVTPVLQQIEADSNVSEGGRQRASAILARFNHE